MKFLGLAWNEVQILQPILDILENLVQTSCEEEKSKNPSNFGLEKELQFLKAVGKEFLATGHEDTIAQQIIVHLAEKLDLPRQAIEFRYMERAKLLVDLQFIR